MKTLKSILLLLFSLFMLNIGQAQNFILWEISGNGLSSPSYLLGTLKFIGEKEFFLPSQVTSRIEKSKLFAIEDQVDHHARHELNKAMHFAEGQSLSKQLSAEDYTLVLELFQKEFGVNKSTFETKYAHIKPLALSILMTRLSLGEKVKFCDMELLRFAKQHKVESYSLESIDREATALNAFPMEAQVKALMHTVKNFGAQKEEYRKLMTDYAAGNLDEIFQYTLHPTENNPVFLEEFYYKRNEEWLPKIEKMMHDKTAFISVGISHLEGERGLLSLLKAKGYTLTGVK